MRALVVIVCFAIGLLSSPFGWAQYAESEIQGQIELVDIPANTVMVNGLNYRVAFDARVEIGGTFGAFTLLQPGMKVRIVYHRISATEREAIELETLPNGTVIEGT